MVLASDVVALGNLVYALFWYAAAGRSWVSDIAAGTKAAITPMDWAGLVLICFVLPAALSWAFSLPLRKWGWIREGDLKLDL